MMEYPCPRERGPLFFPLVPQLKIAAFVSGFAMGLVIGLSYAFANPVPPTPMVRVLVDREKQELRVQGFDLRVRDAITGRELIQNAGRVSVSLRCGLGTKIKLGRDVEVSGPVHVESLGGFIRVGESQYRDDLYIYALAGECMVVNHVDLEKYVAGLLNSEMSARWSLETLKAQAIAARTYAIHQMRERSSVQIKSGRSIASLDNETEQPPLGRSAYYDVDSTVRDQVYEGAHQERYKALRAVIETRGQILTYQGKPIKAFYHSTCGGRTEDPARVWGLKLPYLRPITCGYCVKSPKYTWTLYLRTKDLERKLKARVTGPITSLRVVERNSLGRAKTLELGAHGKKSLLRATDLRDALGTANLQSTDFKVIVADAGGFTFVGHGSGHGVGLCQYGAKAMGEKGFKSEQILKHYYPDALLTRLY